MSQENEKKISQLERALELQKRAREEADQLLEEKSRELYYKNESLKAALEKLNEQQAQIITQEKLASIGQLGASLAHELNNPNAFIKNNLVTLEDYIFHLTNGLDQAFDVIERLTRKIPTAIKLEHAKQSIAKIRETSELDYIREDTPSLMRETLQGTSRISSIANSLRYFANPDTSTRKLTDVNECIKQAQKLVHSNGRLAQLSYELGELPPSMGLPMLLSQALANIIQNAVEARSESPKVLISTKHRESSIIIEITDYGEGIEPRLVEELFRPFYSTKPGQRGLGLGIAKNIIEQHGGEININTTQGKGTTVKITLPLNIESASLKKASNQS